MSSEIPADTPISTCRGETTIPVSDPETDPSNLSGLPGSSETVSDQIESGDVFSESLSETESETESEIDTEYVRDTESDTVISSAEKEKDPPATRKTETTTEEKTETETILTRV